MEADWFYTGKLCARGPDDPPDTVRVLCSEGMARWMREAGVPIARDVPCETSFRPPGRLLHVPPWVREILRASPSPEAAMEPLFQRARRSIAAQ